MAKILFGAFMVDARGKQGGTVFSRNRNGAYARNKVSPVQPNTTAQTNARAILTGTASRFRDLGPDGAKIWNDAALNFPYTDVFGNTSFLTGAQLYAKLNIGLISAGGNYLDTPPAPAIISTIEVSAVNVSSGVGPVGTIDLNAVDVQPNDDIVVRFTPLFSPGISYFKNKLQRVGLIPNADWAAGTVTITALLQNFFGWGGGNPAPAGGCFGVSIQTLNNQTGQMGVQISAKAVIV